MYYVDLTRTLEAVQGQQYARRVQSLLNRASTRVPRDLTISAHVLLATRNAASRWRTREPAYAEALEAVADKLTRDAERNRRLAGVPKPYMAAYGTCGVFDVSSTNGSAPLTRYGGTFVPYHKGWTPKPVYLTENGRITSQPPK